MLRWNFIARLAVSHSLEKEQRLLAFAAPVNPNDRENAENPENKNGGKDDIENSVADIRGLLRQRALVAAPEALAHLPRKDMLLDTVMLGATEELERELKSIAKLKGIDVSPATPERKGIDVSRLSAEQKELLIEVLFRSPKYALHAAKAVQGRTSRFGELTDLIEDRLVTLNIDSTSENELNLTELESILSTARSASPSERDRIEADLIKRLHLERQIMKQFGKETIVIDVLTVIQDAANAEFKRDAFVDPNAKIEDKREAIQEARKKYIDTLQVQLDGTKEYLDASLTNTATALFNEYAKTHDVYTGADNRDTLDRCGVTVNGLKEAFTASTLFAHDCVRTNSAYPQRNLPKTSHESYLAHAERVVKEMEKSVQDLERSSENAGYGEEPVWLRDKRILEERNETTASEIGETVQRLLSYYQKNPHATGAREAISFLSSQNKIFSSFREGNPTLKDRVEMRRLPYHSLSTLKNNVAAMDTQPATSKMAVQSFKAITQSNLSNTLGTREKLSGDLNQALSTIQEFTSHEVCEVIKVHAALENKKQRLQSTIDAQENNDDAGQATQTLAQVENEIASLMLAAELLQKLYSDQSKVSVLTLEEYTKLPADPETEAHWDEATGNIYINASVCNTKEKQGKMIEHERGHAIIDILARKTSVLPNLFVGMHERLQALAKKRGTNYEALVSALANKWKFIRHGKLQAEDFLDELLVRYAEWKSGRFQKPDIASLELFRLLENDTEFEVDNENLVLSVNKKRYSRDALDDEGGLIDDEVANPVERPKVEDEKNYALDLENFEKRISRIDDFFDVYPQHKSGEGVQNLLLFIKQAYGALSQAFREIENPELIKDLFTELNDKIKIFETEIERLDKEYTDLSGADPSKIFSFSKMFSNVHWVTVGDVWSMMKEAGEDITRMWKRRGESARANLGKSLFGLIPKEIPYFGQLAREFEGRSQSSEQEEVGVWEKRYETVDSYTLLNDILGKSRNRDELKAVTNLLTKRGRMDWNFEPYWTVLESLSDYHMPHKACKRDVVLRDLYLQKLTTNIWNDKGQFESWKTQNDSGIESGKSSFKGTLDTLSGTKGGLEARLEYMLQNHIAQKNGAKISKEDEINPHLYEGILHYAMRNGKASLEGKIFFLIQGIAHGLISIDRVKGMLGEQGEILNTFPFIDFFNGKTFSDITLMAKKLGMDDKGENHATTYDYRTTDFILHDIANDEGAQQRASKGISRIAENIDHEDWPGMTAMMEYSDVEMAVSMTSGDRPKMTAQGLQNMYVGYNSLLQSFAVRAKWAKQRGKKVVFTKNEAKKIAKYLAAYVHYDNMVTNAAGKKNRPNLSWNKINDEAPVVGGDHKTKEFRDAMNKFTRRVADSYGIQSVQGKTSAVSIDKYIGTDRSGPPDQSEDILSATSNFVQVLSTKLMSDPETIGDLLADMADRTPATDGFIPENDKYTYENMKPILSTRGN